MPLYFGGTHIGGASVSITTPKLQNKTVTPTTNEQIITPDAGYDGLNQVTVAAGSGSEEIKTCTIHVGIGMPIEYFYGCYVTVTKYIDGNLVPSAYGIGGSTTSLIIENVVCGSMVVIASLSDQYTAVRLSDNMNFLIYEEDYILNNIGQMAAFTAPIEPNVVGEVVIGP